MTTPATPVSLVSIPTPAALSAVPLGLIPPGQLAVCATQYQGKWHYDATSLATPDAVTVVAASGQPGNWHRDPSGTPGAHLIASWFVNTVSGSDSNSGQSSLLPLFSVAEIFRRIGVQPLSDVPTVSINGATAVSVASQAASAGVVTVQTQLASLFIDVPLTVMVPIDIKGAILAAGTPLAAFAGTTPGVTLDNSKAVGVKWQAGTLTTIWTEVDLPVDLDPTYPLTFVVLSSKSGATVSDVLSWTITAFPQTPGALEDASVNIGGVTPALTAAQAVLPAKTISRLAVTIAPTWTVPPTRLSVSLTPSGTLATDNAICNGFWLEYTRRPATSRVFCDLRAAVLAAGTPMAAWASTAGASSSPGVTLDNSKAVGIKWNNNATQTPVWSYIDIPADMDTTKPAMWVVLASKSGATIGDATTFTITTFSQSPGFAEDAGSNIGGVTNALVGNATAKTVSKLTLAIAPNTFIAAPARISVSIQPTNGTLGTDNAVCNGFWLEYTRLASALPIASIDMKDAILAAGTPMAAWASTAGASSSPGITLDNAKAVGVKWNNNAVQVPVWSYVEIPYDMDTTQPASFQILASKSGATAADNTTFTVTAFAQTLGALEDAVANIGGVSGALVGTLAAKTVSQLSIPIAANAISSAATRLSVSIQPTSGTLGTDNAICNGFWLQYVPKASTPR